MIPRRQTTWLFLLLWLSIFAVAYVLITGTNGPKIARATTESGASSEIVIERSRDGHFYVEGSVNSTPVTFLVDTGAGTVAVGPAIARTAHLSGGTPVQMTTAGGIVPAEMISKVTVVAGGIRIEGLRVAVSPAMPGNQALLGQNFLQHVVIAQNNDKLTLRIANRRQEDFAQGFPRIDRKQ